MDEMNNNLQSGRYYFYDTPFHFFYKLMWDPSKMEGHKQDTWEDPFMIMGPIFCIVFYHTLIA